MERKRRFLLIAVGVVAVAALCLVAGAFWSLSGSDGQIRIEGNPSPKDVAEIKAAVASLRRRAIMPNFSWRNIKNLPAGIKRYYEKRIGTITVGSHGTNAWIVLVPRKATPTKTTPAPRKQVVVMSGTNSGLWIPMSPIGNGGPPQFEIPWGPDNAFTATKTPKGWVVHAWDVIIW